MVFKRRPWAARSVIACATAALLSVGALSAAAPASAAPGPAPTADSLGFISSFKQDGATVNLGTQRGAMRVSFLDSKTFRIEADPSGKFSDPANSPQGDPEQSANLVVGAKDFSAPALTVQDGAEITMKTADVTVRANKARGTLSALRPDGTVIFAEASALSFSSQGTGQTTQTLTQQPGEQFIGGGMQNGRTVHTGQVINITKDFNWEDGGNPNAVPYYMSSNGYGVLRDTFAPGSYDFGSNGPVKTSHQENRFDAYYFIGDYKSALDGYTKLSGRPILPPIYAMEYGDADCYNRSNPGYSSSGYTSATTPKQHTIDAVQTAEEFKKQDMPAAWMLVNDGYGCEYTQDPKPYDPKNPGDGLGGTVQEIKDKANLETGLWTQRSLSNQQTEVGQDGISLRKLDVAWVGDKAYRMALTACQSAHDGIEQYSDKRGTSLMVEGWAGSQRCGMQWTGDHTGSLSAIKWAVPALAGSGNSGLDFTTDDIDGIFGGSPESYVRDLQWKAFAPALYSMSGWAPTDKRPWLYGDQATEINRKYLQLRQQLMPFIYSLAARSHQDGTPLMRSMPLEFPADQASYGAEANNQFMLGSDYLVAPISESTDMRNGIELPAGQNWVDYWTGKIYPGGQILNGYHAPLDTLPLFVKAGAVVPTGEIARNASLIGEDSPITLQVYPQGKSSFNLYEDAKTDRSYQSGANSNQEFTVQAPAKNGGDVTVHLGARQGSYPNMAQTRPYQLSVHSGSAPAKVTSAGHEIPAVKDQAAFDAASTGWYYDAATAGGVVHVKTGELDAESGADVVLSGTSAVGGKDQDATAAQVSLQLPPRIFQGAETTATAQFHNFGEQPRSAVKATITTPQGWTIKGSDTVDLGTVAAGTTATATFTLVPGAQAAGGSQTLSVAAHYQDAAGAAQEVVGANQTDVAYGSLDTAFNAVSVTTAANRAKGDFDGNQDSFAAEQLAKADVPAGGVKPGSAVPVKLQDGSTVNYTWPKAGPDVENSVTPAGQTVQVTGSGTNLAVLGSAASGSGATASLTLNYADGTSQKQNLFYPNWLQPKDTGGATVAISEQGRNNAHNDQSPEYTQYKYQVFSNTVPLIPGKKLASVTLPNTLTMKLFDWQVVSQKLSDPPKGDVSVSDLNWVSATNGQGIIGKDVANKDQATDPDKPLVINDPAAAPGAKPTYAKGLGAHAPSHISYYLGGACSSFSSDVGLEDGFGGSIIFTVNGDGKQLYQSRTFIPDLGPEKIQNLDLTGVQYLDLDIDPASAGDIDQANGIWGGAQLHCTAPPHS